MKIPRGFSHWVHAGRHWCASLPPLAWPDSAKRLWPRWDSTARLGICAHRPPLAVTSLLVVVLVLPPALLLRLWPRRHASGLGRLMASAALIQSFATSPRSQPPGVWRQRLGEPLARQLWQHQRGLWWLFWGEHGDAGAYLVVAPGPAPHWQSALQQRQALAINDLWVLAPGPLARQLLQQDLRVQHRPLQGQEGRCTELLRQREAVGWRAAGLGQILGPLTPLAQPWQQGCLSLTAQGERLEWQGEAIATADLAAPAPPVPEGTATPSLPSQGLMAMDGAQFGTLGMGIGTSSLLRQALTSRYGLDADRWASLQGSPFRLRLQALGQGPLKASLSLELQLRQGRGPWQPLLDRLQRQLADQGLVDLEVGRTGQHWTSRGDTTSSGSTWISEGEAPLGGWRWLTPPDQRPARLQLFLGPRPAPTDARWSTGTGVGSADDEIQLTLRPADLGALGLLPEDLPPLVASSDALHLVARFQDRRSALRGWLLRRP